MKINISKIAFNEFLPLKDSLNFKTPKVKAYCYRSTLYHEHMVENIIMTSLNKIAYNYNKEDREQKQLKINSESVDSELDFQQKINRRANCKNFRYNISIGIT